MNILHLAPDGDDSWSGLLPEANLARTDGPLRTLAAAQTAVRRLKAALTAAAEIRVWLRGGTYELDATWQLSAQDSGFPRADARLGQTWPVVWAAWPGETPVISGGRRISGPWCSETINGQEALIADLPAAGKNFRQLWVNDRRARRPCLPKQGVRKVERSPDADFAGWGWDGGESRFNFKAGELSASWRNLGDIELQFFGWWKAPRVGLLAINETQRLAYFDRNTRMRLEWYAGDGVDYRVENVFEALTEPGEWYHDRQGKRLICLPLAGEDLRTAVVTAPRLATLLHCDGAANVRFEGLTFAHSQWDPPAIFTDSIQASYEVPGAVVVQRSDGCAFHGCNFIHLGGYAVEIIDGSVETVLSHCVLRDLGAGGVRIWHGCKRNVVADCEIADGGHLYPAGVGVLIGRSTGNRVEHNHIHDLYYTGISAGWSWGYNESEGYGNLIEWNHIHDIGRGLLSDMGGIYLLGHATGTRVRYNHIHDITCRRYGGWCLYTDEGSSEVLIEGNLCYRTNETAFNQHYGRDNQVRNNIFAHGGHAIFSYGKPEPHLGMVVESNILLARDTPIMRDATEGRWTTQQAMFNRNLYWCEGGPVGFTCQVARTWATQAFPAGFKAAADTYLPLTDAVVTTFVDQAGTTTAPTAVAAFNFSRSGDDLLVEANFRRAPGFETVTGTLYVREHLELFLRPFPDRPVVLQLVLAADGEVEAVWHGCPAPAGFTWQAVAQASNERWQATLRVPLATVLAAAGGGTPKWGYLAAFTTPPESLDLEGWQQRGHDRDGVVADPGFIDAANGDFRLRPDSPALALGFVPVDHAKAGRRPAPKR